MNHSPNHHILVVDDDENLAKLAKVNLEKRGYIVDVTYDGVRALELLKQKMPDLIILDLVMPGISGVDVCRWVRSQSMVPILVLSAHDEEGLKVRALDAGADDYITKPFSYEELLARVRANLRRASVTEMNVSQPVVQIDGLTIDMDARRVFVDGEDIHLTQTEFTLVEELARNKDGIVTHHKLLTRGWGPEYRDATHYLYVYFGRIRKKMGDEYGDLIETVPRMGYILKSKNNTPKAAST
ncbi:MAG: response regulator transcription factor [Chloroflexi bacterium]|nr:response regulator transcription factor [Chloroflexota bacterium]